MTAAVQPVESKRDPLALITQIALAVALVLVATRVTLTESIRDVFATGLAFADLPAAPGATTTLILDLLCWVPALLVLVRRAIDPQYVLRMHWSHLAMILLGVWIWASTFWAGDRFAAVINASTWTAAMSLAWAASQLVRSWTRLRTVLSLGIGILLILIAQTSIYRFYEQPETARNFEENKDKIFAANHWAPDDPVARQYEQKVINGEIIGFYKSPNTLAAVAGLTAFIAAGFAIQRLLDRDPIGFAIAGAVPAVLAFFVMYLAGSKTAIAGSLMFAAILVAAWLSRKRLAERQRLFFWCDCGVFALGVAVVVSIGLKTGGLIQDSLNFRWNYWVASWKVFLEHKWIGVGWSSFADAYLKHRLPVATEEIKDPHNFLIHFLVETGLIGLMLVVAWLGRSWYEMTRPLSPRQTKIEPGSIVGFAVAIAVAFLALRMIAGGGISFLLTELIKLLLFGVLILLGLILGGVHGKKEEGSGDLSADARPAPFLLYATIAGLGGFMLHSLVDFPMFENGPLVLMMLLLGAVLGVRHKSVAGQPLRTWAALLGLGGVFLALILETLLVVVPVATAESKAADADAAADAKLYGSALSLYREAMAASPVPNADYALRATRVIPLSEPADLAGMLNQAIAANPASVSPWLQLARLGRQTNDAPNRVIQNYSAVIARNPNDPTLRLEFGDYLEQIGQHAQAVEQYKAGLAANAAMHKDEPRRLPANRVAEIEARIK